MNGNAERKESGPAYAGQPEVPKSAKLIYYNAFSEYSALPGGHLTREEFNRVVSAFKNPATEVNKNFAANAETIADVAGIALTDESLIFYSVLRSDREISSELLNGDPQVLAEVLRIQGRAEDAKKLIDAYHAVNPGMKF